MIIPISRNHFNPCSTDKLIGGGGKKARSLRVHKYVYGKNYFLWTFLNLRQMWQQTQTQTRRYHIAIPHRTIFYLPEWTAKVEEAKRMIFCRHLFLQSAGCGLSYMFILAHKTFTHSQNLRFPWTRHTFSFYSTIFECVCPCAMDEYVVFYSGTFNALPFICPVRVGQVASCCCWYSACLLGQNITHYSGYEIL